MIPSNTYRNHFFLIIGFTVLCWSIVYYAFGYTRNFNKYASQLPKIIGRNSKRIAPDWLNFTETREKQHLLNVLLKKTCINNTAQVPYTMPYKMTDVLLVVSFNYPNYLVIPYLEVLYSGVFPNIVYCGDGKPTAKDLQGFKIRFMNATVDRGGVTYNCMLEAMKKYGNQFAGYLHASDDIAMNVWNFYSLSHMRPWYHTNDASTLTCAMREQHCNSPGFKCAGRKITWLGFVQSKKQIRDVLKILHSQHSRHFDECIERLTSYGAGQKTAFFIGEADFYYVPGKMVTSFVTVGNLFYQHRLLMEVAVPTLIYCLSPQNEIQLLPGKMYWQNERSIALMKKFEIHERTDSFFHPAKFASLLQSHQTPDVRAYFCKYFRKLYQSPERN